LSTNPGTNKSLNLYVQKTFKMSKFLHIFKDTNDWNEKTIIGFLSFAVMILVMLADVITGFCGVDLPINEFTYNSFVIVTLGSFGIAGIEKFAKKS